MENKKVQVVTGTIAEVKFAKMGRYVKKWVTVDTFYFPLLEFISDVAEPSDAGKKVKVTFEW